MNLCFLVLDFRHDRIPSLRRSLLFSGEAVRVDPRGDGGICVAEVPRDSRQGVTAAEEQAAVRMPETMPAGAFETSFLRQSANSSGDRIRLQVIVIWGGEYKVEVVAIGRAISLLVHSRCFPSTSTKPPGNGHSRSRVFDPR